MNSKQLPIYLCSFTKERKNHIQKEGLIVGHEFGNMDRKKFIWPKNIGPETINPKIFIELKKHFKLEKILLIDRLIGTSDVVSINNHVNRSGKNFLREKTPEGRFPQFPDMSKIYHNVPGLRKETVHTIGKKRLKNLSSNEKVIWSELVGLIAPVVHYVGIKVFAIGGNNFDVIRKTL